MALNRGLRGKRHVEHPFFAESYNKVEMKLQEIAEGRCKWCGRMGELIADTGICTECSLENMPRSIRNISLAPQKKRSTLYLHHISKLILTMLYKDAEPTPIGFKDYSFICQKTKKIKIASSCIVRGNKSKSYAEYWSFSTQKNKIPDEFLLIAYDDREHLTPLHMWMVPGARLNKVNNINIYNTRSQIDAWRSFEVDISEINELCRIVQSEEVPA